MHSMKGKRAWSLHGASKVVACAFGLLAGLGGITHGIGEVLQGNVVPEKLWIYSWATGPIATNMGGEPGITIVPNFLITGILAIVVSAMVMVWSVGFIQEKRGGWMLIILSITMLLVGGGVGPPIIGVLAGVAGLGANTPLYWWRKQLSPNSQRFLTVLWPWLFGAGLINGVFLTIGSLILVYFFDLNNPDLFTNSFFLMVVLLILMIFTGRAYDLQKNRNV